jgi:hypothetical protein
MPTEAVQKLLWRTAILSAELCGVDKAMAVNREPLALGK